MSSEAVEVTAEVIEPSNALEVVYTPAVFSDNLAALEAYVDQQIAPYIGAQINPADYDQVKQARKCMADLNKLKEPIEAERKRVKREYEAPLKLFEGKVKGITSKIDQARADLKAQVDEADARFKESRRDMLAEEYEGCAGAIVDVIPFAAILEDGWLNRSTPETKAVNELYEKVESALKGYRALESKQLAHKDEVVKHYADTLDLVSALELEDELNERDREMAEFKAAQAAVAIEEVDPAVTAHATGGSVFVADRAEGPATITADRGGAEAFAWHLSMDFEGSREFAQRVGSTLKAMGISGATIKCTGVCHG